MAHVMTAHVISVMRWEMEGVKGSKVTIVQDSAQTDRRIGKEIIQVTAPYEAFETLKPFADELPKPFEMDFEMGLAAGGKATVRILDLRPIQHGKQTPQPAKS